jgi:Fic family protein
MRGGGDAGRGPDTVAHAVAAAEPAAPGARPPAVNGGARLTLELSRAQVDQIVRAASKGGSVSTLLASKLDSPERLAETLADFDDTRLSRSLLSGLLVFATFPANGESLGNIEVARMLGMNPSTAHRYISTFLELGLLERDAGTRRYRLAA